MGTHQSKGMGFRVIAMQGLQQIGTITSKGQIVIRDIGVDRLTKSNNGFNKTSIDRCEYRQGGKGGGGKPTGKGGKPNDARSGASGSWGEDKGARVDAEDKDGECCKLL